MRDAVELGSAGTGDGIARRRPQDGRELARHDRRDRARAATLPSAARDARTADGGGPAAGYSEQGCSCAQQPRRRRRLGSGSGSSRTLYIPQALEYCIAHSEDLWRINALALRGPERARPGTLDRGGRLRRRLLQDPRESPWPHHEALVVLALVRARRGDRAPTPRSTRPSAVGVPPDEVDVQLDLAAARAEIAWLEQRRRRTSPPRRHGARGGQGAQRRGARHARVCRSGGRWPGSTIEPASRAPRVPMRSRSRADGSEAAGRVDAAVASRTRRRWR